MKAVRENSVVVTPIKETKKSESGIIMSVDRFKRGQVISSANDLVSEGDVIYYEDSLVIGESEVVFEGNIICKE